jgi:hypothetical protein
MFLEISKLEGLDLIFLVRPIKKKEKLVGQRRTILRSQIKQLQIEKLLVSKRRE